MCHWQDHTSLGDSSQKLQPQIFLSNPQPAYQISFLQTSELLNLLSLVFDTAYITLGEMDLVNLISFRNFLTLVSLFPEY